MRYQIATDLKTRTGAPEGKDARLKNAYVEVRGDQSVVRKRPQAQGGVSVGSGVPQGGIGLIINGTPSFIGFWGDTLTNYTGGGTNWAVGTSYVTGDHVSVDFVDYWALDDNAGNNPTSSPSHWSRSKVPAVPRIYATWNPADKTSVTLSNGDLTAFTSQGTVRSTIGKSSGKWYWEYSVTSTHPYDGTTIQSFGVANLSSVLGSEIGNDANGWAYSNLNAGLGYKENAFSFVSYGSPIPLTTNIGIALDMTAGTLKFYLDGVDQGIAFSGLTGTLYAGVGAQTQVVSNMTVIANFGATAFAYSVPSGYNSGLYT